jgi:hypothetical protein
MKGNRLIELLDFSLKVLVHLRCILLNCEGYIIVAIRVRVYRLTDDYGLSQLEKRWKEINAVFER